MASLLEQQSADLTLTGFGQKGGILLTDTTAITGEFRTIVALTDCVFSVLTTNYTKNGTVTATTGADWGTLYEGSMISGKITAVTLTSGKLLLVK